MLPISLHKLPESENLLCVFKKKIMRFKKDQMCFFSFFPVQNRLRKYVLCLLINNFCNESLSNNTFFYVSLQSGKMSLVIKKDERGKRQPFIRILKKKKNLRHYENSFINKWIFFCKLFNSIF